jgi:phage tail-like protein
MADDGYDLQRITTSTFLVEVDGVEIGRFMEISGLEVHVGVEELDEGGQNGFVHKLPGRMTWPNLTLRRGITQQDTLLDWLRTSSGEQFTANGNKLTRKTAAITLVGPAGQRLRAWEVEGAFPIRWSGPRFASESAETPVEELEITHHGFRAKQLG